MTIELSGVDGTRQTHEVARGGCADPHSTLDPLGLTLRQRRTFEVMAVQVSNDDGKPVLFSGVPGEADQQHAQLNGVLSGLGMTADTEVTILIDGADGPRSLGEAASTGTVFHVLDWFH